MSTESEKELYSKVKNEVDCWFMIKFWLMYWMSSAQFSYLGLFKGQLKASAFIEQFTFIMHMKDLVKLQLSMRKLA